MQALYLAHRLDYHVGQILRDFQSDEELSILLSEIFIDAAGAED